MLRKGEARARDDVTKTLVPSLRVLQPLPPLLLRFVPTVVIFTSVQVRLRRSRSIQPLFALRVVS